MLGYKCRYCGAVKFPDGKGCGCGASWGSLEVVELENTLRPQEKNYNSEKER